MWQIQFNSVLFPILSAVALLFSPSLVQAADISDAGSFFSAEALAKANQTIREIEEKAKHEIRIETFAAVPADKIDAVKKMNKADRETFFTKWLHERADKTKARGVFVLICKEPAHLRMWGAKEIQQAGFGAEQAKPVRELLLSGFKAKEYDKTLTAALTQLATTFDGLKSVPKKGSEPAGLATRKHDPAARPNQTAEQPPVNRVPQPVAAARGANWSNTFFVIAMIVGGLFLFSAVMRMFGGSRNYGPSGQGGYGGGYGGGGGGSGFMSGIAGGIFGAVAGNWLYNQFSGNHASASETHGSGHDSSNLTDASSSYNDDILDSGSDNSGGTDFGGGDFDGGDFGGDGGGDF
ncbi:MAG: TPM domain-containing protein [Planctomycetia bacterium]|nr:TPM domain-containing protein [Planctomycetia bacterium]